MEKRELIANLVAGGCIVDAENVFRNLPDDATEKEISLFIEANGIELIDILPF